MGTTQLFGYHLLIADDLSKEFSDVLTDTKREELSTRFHSEILTRGEPNSKVILIGSRRHPEELQGRLMGMNDLLPEKKRWHEIKMPAISIDADGNEKALWEERYSLEDLHNIRKEYELDGKSYLFDCLYQQDPRTDSALLEFPEEWFKDIFYSELPTIKQNFAIVALDPSKGSTSKKGDYAALLYIILDESGCLWIEDSKMVKCNTERLEDYTVQFIETYAPRGTIVESNAFQALIATNIERKCKDKGIHPRVFKHINSMNKEVRIRLTLTPLLNAARIRFKDTPSNRIIVSQMREFPASDHDDGADACELGVQLLKKLTNHKSRDLQNIRLQS